MELALRYPRAAKAFAGLGSRVADQLWGGAYYTTYRPIRHRYAAGFPSFARSGNAGRAVTVKLTAQTVSGVTHRDPERALSGVGAGYKWPVSASST